MKHIIDFLEEKFNCNVSYEMFSNSLFLKISGLDNHSLAKYIYDNFDSISVTVKQKEGYKISDFGWIKIEKNNKKELNLC